ncbi:metallophosphoesterase [Methylobacter tundripaludum SV96]|uniref:Metallophosphoesterase n=2 Tax=Methylobacter tundripaludum TaxID=173365 RepID=G3J264_METTV|nr:metallophosphoesterase [Methylobacter tundripaludum SV96]
MSSDSNVIATVVHLSDIHFGFTGPEPVWDELVRFVLDIKPAAILITGDIVNTPGNKLFNLAQSELKKFGDVPVLICPGNHDRHWLGNALGSLQLPFTRDFYYFLKDWFRGAPHYEVLDLGARIVARVTAIDSSDKCSYFARSFVDADTLKNLAQAVDNKKQDDKEKGKLNIRIVMTHHHLLPVVSLEAKYDQLIGPFQTATTLTVNAGTVLKTLSEGHVDLVLHGHEHEKNIAKYTTIENRLGNVTIIGAGSSTGTITGKGWYFSKASFNVIEVCEDDSIWLRTYFGSGKTFSSSTENRHLLFEAVDLRRARYYLTHNIDETEALGLKLHFRFLVNRDIIVHRSYFNISLIDNTHEFSVYSETGKLPKDLKVWVVDKDGNKIYGDVGEGFYVDKKRTNAWRCKAKFPVQIFQFPYHVVTSYRWEEVGMLTREHIDKLPAQSRGPLYSDYLKHVYYLIPPLDKMPATLDISVDLPTELAPDDAPGNVFVYTQAEGENCPVHSIALTKTIYSSGEGHYALRVDYPDPETKYFLAWLVRNEPKVMH